MYNDKNLDNMTQRYKDEMMRIYREQQRKQGTAPVQNQAAAVNQNPVITSRQYVPEAEISNNIPANPVITSPDRTPPMMNQENENVASNGPFNYSEHIIDSTEQGFVKCPVNPQPEYRPMRHVEKAPPQTMTTSKFRSPQEILNEMTNDAPAMQTNRMTTQIVEGTTQNLTPDTPSVTTAQVSPVTPITPVTPVNPDNDMMTRNSLAEGTDMNMPVAPDIPVPDEVLRELDIMKSADKPSVQANDVIFNPKEINTADADFDSTVTESEIGYLQIETYVSNQAIPIAGATAIVSQVKNGGTNLVRSLITDKSGKTETIPLPAPPKNYSEEEENTQVQPYAKYIIRVEAEGFYPEENLDVPIFATIKSIQPFQLVPLPEYTPQDTQSAISSKLKGAD